MSIKQTPRCRRGFEPLDFLGDPTLCAIKAGDGNARTAWRLGYGIDRQGMPLVMMRGALVQRDEGRGCTDAVGRFYPGCGDLYTHPDGESAPYTFGGYTVPTYCEDLPPTPTPRPTPAGPTPTPYPASAGFPPELGGVIWNTGSSCHALSPVPNGQVRCLKDSTQRYVGGICDRDHGESFNGPCHGRTWDDIRGPIWTISPDIPQCRGDDRENCWRWYTSHTRVFYLDPNVEWSVTTCPRPDVGAPVDHVTYESGGFDSIIRCDEPMTEEQCEAARESVARIPIPIRGDGCRSAILDLRLE